MEGTSRHRKAGDNVKYNILYLSLEHENSSRRAWKIHGRRSLFESSSSSQSKFSAPESFASEHDSPWKKKITSLKLKEEFQTETSKRNKRRLWQKKRERESAIREKRGKKPYYLFGNHSRKPYGESNKLAHGLDPSVIDVRQQSHEDIMTVVKRLDDNFDYSEPLSLVYLT